MQAGRKAGEVRRWAIYRCASRHPLPFSKSERLSSSRALEPASNRSEPQGLPFAYVWLFFEVGLVEEFFFRALLQSRLAALLRSEVTGIVLMALFFGLAHAPGLHFRSTATLEGLGPHPSWLVAIGYSIAVTSVAGIFLGVLWMRTRNLLVVMIVHAAGDLIPNLAHFVKAW